MRRALLTMMLAGLLIAAPRADDPLAGVYRVDGTNASGKPYTGMVEIAQQGSVYILHWVMGQEESYGVGFVSKGQLVVAAGPPTQVGVMLSNAAAYTIKKGQPLVGQWVMPGSTKVFQETLTKTEAKMPPPIHPSPAADVREHV